jgi:hypothetical protein
LNGDRQSPKPYELEKMMPTDGSDTSIDGGGTSAAARQPEQSNLVPGDVVALIAAASLAVLVPHIALLKLLVRKGIVGQQELRSIHEKTLKTDGYPPRIASVLEPIWKSFKRDLSIDD